MPYEEYLDRIHEYNHRIVVARRITANKLKQERMQDVGDFIVCMVLGMVCIGLLYFFVAWGGTYR